MLTLQSTRQGEHVQHEEKEEAVRVWKVGGWKKGPDSHGSEGPETEQGV